MKSRKALIIIIFSESYLAYIFVRLIVFLLLNSDEKICYHRFRTGQDVPLVFLF